MNNRKVACALLLIALFTPLKAQELIFKSSFEARAKLFIPPGALPEGVTPDDITISEVSVDLDFYIEKGVEPPLAIFRLEPDGLQFSEPVTLSVELSVNDPTNRTFLAFVSALEPSSEQEAVEFVMDAESAVNLETNILTASIQLTHFSDVWIDFYENYFDVNPFTVSASEVLIGQTFETAAVVTRTVEPTTLISIFRTEIGLSNYYMGHDDTIIAPQGDDTWSLEGSMSAVGPVEPRKIENIPPLTVLSGNTFTIPPRDFECTSGGSVLVEYNGTARYHVMPAHVSFAWVLYGDLQDRTEEISRTTNESVQCVLPRIIATAAPPFTTYTLSPDVPGGASFFAWSGANCGSVTGSTTSTMVWDHGGEDCEHAGEAHPDATISVLVAGAFPLSGKSYELRCEYISAASGEGPECVQIE